MEPGGNDSGAARNGGMASMAPAIAVISPKSFVDCARKGMQSEVNRIPDTVYFLPVIGRNSPCSPFKGISKEIAAAEGFVGSARPSNG